MPGASNRNQPRSNTASLPDLVREATLRLLKEVQRRGGGGRSCSHATQSREMHLREETTRASRSRDHRLVANGHLQSACNTSRRGAQLRKTKEIRNICGRAPCGTQLHLGIAAGKARGSWQERARRSERRRAQRRCGEGCEEAAHSVRRESQPALKAVGSCNSCNEPRPFPVTSR